MKISRQQQDGFVSIIVAMIVLIFVTLVALGFAFLARQNQRENENRVLSTQAFYAAESAVNDTVKLLKTGTAPVEKTACAPSGTGTIGSSNSEVKYTCLLYNMAPKTLEYPDIEAGEERVVKVQSYDGSNLGSITISWQDKDGGSSFVPAASGNHFLPQSSYDLNNGYNLATATGMIRATLIPIYSSGITRNDLSNRTQTLFLYPRAGAGTGSQAFITTNSLSDPSQGVFADGRCNTTNAAPLRKCNVTITGVSGPQATSTFYVRIRALYKASGVTISAKNTSNADVRLANEQATIDATGKANDVVRRIQVRVPLDASSEKNRPPYAIESVDSICKRLQAWPGGAAVATVPSFTDPKTGSSTTVTPAACDAFH